ncbi:ankyrin-1-like protein [Dinothrombium tinctorium]|uniref:Alpha-latrotoxin n=1 Tax=Dinothrombium tinctorium TaxID=1965070 RepID=A0A3S3PNE1_9ACAR|nr:ankyrin-1-like protein [Dinothrombium tinctorium]RWS03884.1 ankyrin-1-like protein [Dinothrombium tinctorium]RWS04998.1 ankyrin-1-like protein [Dinothrombium tinctorium]
MSFKLVNQQGKRLMKTLICDLHLAISLGNVKEVENVVEKLIELEADCDINLITLIGNASPLSYAVYKSNIDIVRLLLRYRCDPNRLSKDHLGRIEPPLCSAVRIGNIDVIAALLNLSQGLNINQTDFFNQTPLWLAVKNRRLDIVELIVNNETFSLDCESFRLQKSSPVYLAAKYLNNRAKILDFLIDSGITWSCFEDGYKGSSVLHWMAAVHKNVDFVNKMILAGVSQTTLLQLKTNVAIQCANKMFPLSLQDSVRIYIRKQIINKTKRPLTYKNIAHHLPQIPNILIHILVNLK